MVKSVCYSFRGPEFGSKYLSQAARDLLVTPAPGDLMPSSGLLRHLHTCGIDAQTDMYILLLKARHARCDGNAMIPARGR